MAMSTIPTLSIGVIMQKRSPGRNRANVLSGMGRMTTRQAAAAARDRATVRFLAPVVGRASTVGRATGVESR